MNCKSIKLRDSKARREVTRSGHRLIKSRARNWNINNQLGYMIIDSYNNFIVYGSRMELTLEDIEEWIYNQVGSDNNCEFISY